MSLNIDKSAVADSTPPDQAQAKPSTPENKPFVPGTPEYDAEMVRIAKMARGEADTQAPQNNDNNAAESPPEGVPEKFIKDGKLDLQALVKSYSELEKRFSQGGQQQQEQSPPPADAPAETQVIAGLNVEELTAEVDTKGELSSETREKLLKGGIPAALIDSYLQMYQVSKQAVETQRQAEEAAVRSAVGGDAAYQQLITWAASALTPAEVEAFNRQVAIDKDSALLAVTGLQARFAATNGQAPRLVTGAPSTSASDIFQSKAEFLEAMADRRYHTSEAYRAQVAAKLTRSRSAGVAW